MFNWVVKVVPQPPEKPGKLGEKEKDNTPQAPERKELKEPELKPATNPVTTPKEDDVSEENSTGVLTWLSQGLASALPQPVTTPKLERANADAKEENTVDSKAEEESGVINWIVQELGKAVPHLDDKHRQLTQPQKVMEIPKAVPEVKIEPVVQEVKEVKEVKDVIELKELKVVKVEPVAPPPVLVVEVAPVPVHDAEPEGDKSITPRVMEWIKQGLGKVVPQPGHALAGTDGGAKKEAPPPETTQPPQAPVPSPAEEVVKAANVEGESNMVGWIVQGLGRMMPQPVLKPKEEALDEVQSREKVMRAP